MYRLVLLLAVAACGKNAALDPDQVTHDRDFPMLTFTLAEGNGHVYGRAENAIEVIDGDDLVSAIPLRSFEYGAMAVAGNTLYAFDNVDLHVIDVTDPTILRDVAQWPSFGPSSALAADPDQVYAVGASGLWASDLTGRTDWVGGVSGDCLKVVDGEAYVGIGYGIERATVGTRSLLLVETKPEAAVHGIETLPGYLYGITDTSLVWGIDDDPNLPLTSQPVDGKPTSIRIADDRLLVGSDDGTVTFFDLTDPLHPASIGTIHANAHVNDLAVTDGYLYVATSEDLEVFAR